MKGAVVKIGENKGNCLLSEMSRHYVGVTIKILHRESKKNIQRGLCKVIGKKSLRNNLISDMREEDSVEKLELLNENTKDTKLFIVINPAQSCKVLDWVNETKSFAKDIVTYSHGIEEWLIYSTSVGNLNETLDVLKNRGVKVKAEQFFDLPIDMVFNRSFDFLANMGLTDRQLEILKTAWNLGYYDKQKKITLKEIANKFDVSEPTIWESLRSAEYKIMLSLSDYFIFDF